jgi:nicotinamide mononucleotide transporter
LKEVAGFAIFAQSKLKAMQDTFDLIVQIISILALVTGVPYMIFEVLQKNIMWYFGFFTGIACAFTFGVQSNWAMMGLNIYYTVMAVWGLYQWKKDSAKIKSESNDLTIHLNRMSLKTLLWSILAMAVLSGMLIWLLHLLNGNNVILDGISTALSIVAMVWLAKSYRYHWYLWILADTLLTVMCILQQSWWMALLYFAYVIASIIGFVLWKRKGVYVDDK